jgi:hypothetical protein
MSKPIIQHGACINNLGTDLRQGNVYYVREMVPRSEKYYSVKHNGVWSEGYWKTRFKLLPKVEPLPFKPKKVSKYLSLKLLRNTEFWKCDSNGQPNDATRVEINKQADAIFALLQTVPVLIVRRVALRLANSPWLTNLQ